MIYIYRKNFFIYIYMYVYKVEVKKELIWLYDLYFWNVIFVMEVNI